MYEWLSVEEIYDMGMEYVTQANNAAKIVNAATGEEKDAAWEEMNKITEKAMGCFRAAAERGHIASQYELAMLLDVVQVPDVAFGWALKAAEQGHGEACDYVARAYREGKGVPQDLEQAEYWRKQAIRNGSGQQAAYIQEKVAAEMKEKARDVGFWGIILLILEVTTLFVSPLLSTVVAFCDMAFFDAWQYKILRGYDQFGDFSLIKIRHYLSEKVHLFLLGLMFFMNWLCLIPLAFAKFFLGIKMERAARNSLPPWNDSASWDWEKYAEDNTD